MLGTSMSQLNIWSHSMSVQDLIILTEKCENVTPKPDILDWSEVTIESFANNSTLISDQNEKAICHYLPEPILKHIPIRVPMEKAYDLCQNLGGKMFLPKNDPTDQFSRVEWFREKCGTAIWIPVVKGSNEAWVQYPNKATIAPYLPWDSDDPNGNELQVGFQFKCVINRSTKANTFSAVSVTFLTCPRRVVRLSISVVISLISQLLVHRLRTSAG